MLAIDLIDLLVRFLNCEETCTYYLLNIFTCGKYKDGLRIINDRKNLLSQIRNDAQLKAEANPTYTIE
jgi:hypothetical protein